MMGWVCVFKKGGLKKKKRAKGVEKNGDFL